MRFFGEVGYADTTEDPPGSGVWVNDVSEVQYYGDVIRNTKNLDPGESLNDDITVGNSISIIADDYANIHFFNIVYVRWAGALWSVPHVEIKSPRLILTLGGVYNGPTP